MFSFFAGLALGLVVTVSVTIVPILARFDKLSDSMTANIEKLLNARKRLGQIANRQSIGEARKIANTALKELDQ